MSRRIAPLLVLFVAAAGFAACPGPSSAPAAGDAGTDAGAEGPGDAGDAGAADAGTPDAGTPGDAGVDAGTCDPLEGAGAGASQACRMCVENAGACQGVLTAYQSDCTAYSQCVCACGGGASCANTCKGSATSACQTDIKDLLTCGAQACSSECGLGGSDGGGLPDGGTWCGALAACCPDLPSSDQGTCTEAVSFGNQSVCERAVEMATSNGISCGGDAGAPGDAG